MERKTSIDAAGAIMLIGFSLLLAFNQVVVKVTNGGFQPVFLAGLRSVGALLILLVWMRIRGIPLGLTRAVLPAGVFVGALFAFEFTCLFIAVDVGSVSRSSMVFYSMPIWLAAAAHFLLPNEQLSGRRLAGFCIAMAGVAWALLSRDSATAGSLWGDLAALGGAFGWGGIALTIRLSKLGQLRPEQQLFWQLLISGPILLAIAPFFGPFIRDLGTIHIAGLAFQIIAVASFGFLFWFWLLARYPASGVSSFSFLSPVFSVLLGWQLLNEAMHPSAFAALAMIAVGLILINKPARKPA